MGPPANLGGGCKAASIRRYITPDIDLVAQPRGHSSLRLQEILQY